MAAPPTTGVGIDYGTSNSAAAVFDGRRVRLVRLEAGTAFMPSATCIDRGFGIHTGQAAIDRYIESNTGRTVELSAEVLGEASSAGLQADLSGAPKDPAVEKIYGRSLIDAGQSSRLFRGVKRLLGDRDASRMMVFGRPFRLVALVTPVLLRMRRSVEAALAADGHDSRACVGHPVNFEGSAPDRNRRALHRLDEACGHAGLDRRGWCPEPVAAALSYLHGRPFSGEETLLVVDFGGGTLDLCALRRQRRGFRVIAVRGVALGGDHIDRLMFRELLFPMLGKGEMWTRPGQDRAVETPFPFGDYEELLLNWPISHLLNQNRYTAPLARRIAVGDAAAGKFRRLYDLIKMNCGYLAFQAVKELKAALSVETVATLDIPELDIEIDVTRERFERMIAPVVREAETALGALLADAGLERGDVDLVVRTGGSSLIPAVRRLLERLFPDKVVEHDPFTSVAAGLAIAGRQGLGAGLREAAATGGGAPADGGFWGCDPAPARRATVG